MTVTMDIHRFKSIVKERCGLSFEAEKMATLASGLRARMTQRGIATYPEYLECILRDDNEFNSLVNLLTINETYFFREPVHLDLLADKLMGEMLANRKPGDPIRIFCAGCSTGEEPYSVMMKLVEKYGIGVRNLISITGADIDTDVLRKAEQGIYSGFSFREFPVALREKYFEPAGNKFYRIRDFVKEKVKFMQLNLMSDVYPDALNGMDVIFYRNVSIYFEPETQKSIFERLAGLLREAGWLFVSSTETLSHNHGSLSLVELDGVFCYQKKTEFTITDERKQPSLASAPQGTKTNIPTMKPSRITVPSCSAPVRGLSSAPKPGPSAVATRVHDKTRADGSLFDEALTLAKNKNYEKSLSLINDLLGADPSFARGYMLKAGILINLKRLEEAERVCQRTIELDRWSLEGNLLLGLIAKLRNDSETAVRRFKEALYIQSSCWLAHFYLAEIHGELGERKNAAREYEIVVKLLQKDNEADHGLTFFPLAFPTTQIAHLCHYNLKKLKQGKA